MNSNVELPITVVGDPQVQTVRAVYRYEHTKPNEVRWIEVRKLTTAEWDAAVKAHREIYTSTRGLDGFPSFAWGDLKSARDELLRQLKDQAAPDEWMATLLEYRILNYSTSLKLYHEYVIAQVNRTGDEEVKARVEAEFSTLYDRSFGYRLIYSMRNAFQHGVRGLVSLRATVRLVDGSDTELESEAHAYLAKDVFAAGRSNAAVRRQVRGTDDDIDLFKFSEEVFGEIQALHIRLDPLIHPGVPAAAQMLLQYIKELGGERPHFHKYVRGAPMKILEICTLDRGGFDYVVRQAGARATYEGRLPSDALAVLPSYPPSRQPR